MPETRWNNALYYLHNKYLLIVPSIMEASFLVFKTALRYSKIEELTIITFLKFVIWAASQATTARIYILSSTA